MARKDLWAGLIMALLGALVVFVLIPYGVVEPRRVRFAALSPSYYPRIVGYALLLLGIAVSIKSLVHGSEPFSGGPQARPDGPFRIAVFAGLLVVFAASLPWLGFVLASTLAMAAAMVLAGERRPHVIAPLAIGVPLGLYFFFLKVASVPIPLGVLAPYLQGI